MNEQLTYRLMASGEEASIVDLVLRIFDEAVAPLYSPEGIAEFRGYVRPEALLARSRANHFVLVAAIAGTLVGMVEVRDYSHISLLFVDAPHRRKGIARELLRSALEMCLEHRIDLREVTVNSAPDSVDVYHRLGFKTTGPEMTVNGIRFTPMSLELL